MRLIKLHCLRDSYPSTSLIGEIFLNPSSILYLTKQKDQAINLDSIFNDISSIDSSFSKEILNPTIITLSNNSELIVAESLAYIRELLFELK